MGATVTTGKKAYAYADKDGQPVYVLYEQTYEKNCYPHDPHWSAIAFGRIEAVMKAIFLNASETCGGMLQGRNGYITANGYVAGWLKELAAPRQFTDVKTHLVVKENGWTNVISTEKADAVYKALYHAGRIDIADRLVIGEVVTLSYRDDTDALCALATIIAPWRFVSRCGDRGETSPDSMAIRYQKNRATTPPSVTFPGVYRLAPKGGLNGDDIFIISENGCLVIGPQGYRLAGDWVASYWKHELSHPGRFQSMYQGLKDHLDTVPVLPAGTLVRIDLAKAPEGWMSNARELADAIGPDGMTFGELRAEWPKFRAIVYLGDAVSLTLPGNVVPEHADTSTTTDMIATA